MPAKVVIFDFVNLELGETVIADNTHIAIWPNNYGDFHWTILSVIHKKWNKNVAVSWAVACLLLGIMRLEEKFYNWFPPNVLFIDAGKFLEQNHLVITVKRRTDLNIWTN